MFIRSPSFTASQLSCDQQRLAAFIEQWKAIRKQRGARYNLWHTIPLNGAYHVAVSVICLDEIAPGVYLLEAAPLGSDPHVRHYANLTRTADGEWRFGKVVAGADHADRTPRDRGQLIRECFVE